jgi:hypothetical protein
VPLRGAQHELFALRSARRNVEDCADKNAAKVEAGPPVRRSEGERRMAQDAGVAELTWLFLRSFLSPWQQQSFRAIYRQIVSCLTPSQT